MAIKYEFFLDNVPRLKFKVDPNRHGSAPSDGSDWTRLGCHTCPNCPLKETATEHCPAALDTHPVIAKFGDLISHRNIKVRVSNGERTITTECDAQTAISPLLGLIMATSECPILSRLRPLARIHMPFQSLEETQFRLVGAWMLGQLGASERGTEPDWNFTGLDELLEEIGIVNQAFMKRLKQAATEDASFNALAMLAASTLNAKLSLDDPYADLADFAIT